MIDIPQGWHPTVAKWLRERADDMESQANAAPYVADAGGLRMRAFALRAAADDLVPVEDERWNTSSD